MAKDSWPVRITGVVAGRVRSYRLLRGMSTRTLAERCGELGFAIPQPVLSNLELGRRESISVAELLVLAQVLDVSPTLLITPVEIDETVEILPGRRADSADVLEWFAGETDFSLTRTGLSAKHVDWTDQGPKGFVHLYRYHRILVDLVASEVRLGNLSGQIDMKDITDGGPGELRSVRQVMREDELRVPDLPPGLAFIDGAMADAFIGADAAKED